MYTLNINFKLYRCKLLKKFKRSLRPIWARKIRSSKKPEKFEARKSPKSPKPARAGLRLQDIFLDPARPGQRPEDFRLDRT